MKKDDIRRTVRARKTLLNDDERISAADAVFSTLEQMAAFTLADHILMYHSLPDELSTHRFLEKWHDKKRFYLPRVNGVDLDILPYDRTRTHLGAFHIEEPDGDDTVDISAMDLVIVPAVAYDHNGNRVGRGKGFYDRLLRECRAMKIGVAYDFQLFDEIDTEDHDVSVDIVVTQNRTLRIRRHSK